VAKGQEDHQTPYKRASDKKKNSLISENTYKIMKNKNIPTLEIVL
jgi:hypothetical protein